MVIIPNLYLFFKGNIYNKYNFFAGWIHKCQLSKETFPKQGKRIDISEPK